MVVLSVWRREPRSFWRHGEWSTCFPHPFLFYYSSITHSQRVCVGVAMSAVEMHSVVQLCCYFVVSSFVHSFYTYLQDNVELLKKWTGILVEKEKQQTLEKQQVSPPRTGTKRGSGYITSDGNTPTSKASKHSAGSVHDQPGEAWLYKATLTNPLRARGLRKSVFDEAATWLAFLGHIRYAEDAPPEYDSLLEVELYFEEKGQASAFDTAIHKVAYRYRAGNCVAVIEKSLTKCRKVLSLSEKIYENSYAGAVDSPNRLEVVGYVDASSAASPTTTQAICDPDVMCNEGLSHIDRNVEGSPFQWCHIKKQKDCTADEKKDPSNRLVMDVGLHELYDGTSGIREKSYLSVYCRQEDMPQTDSDEIEEIVLQIIFANNGLAQRLSASLREGATMETLRQYAVTIKKAYAQTFVSYVNQRHAQNIQTNMELEETGDIALANAPHDTDVANTSDLDDCEEEEEEGSLVVPHSCKRVGVGNRMATEWECCCHGNTLAEGKHRYKCHQSGCKVDLCVECGRV